MIIYIWYIYIRIRYIHINIYIYIYVCPAKKNNILQSTGFLRDGQVQASKIEKSDTVVPRLMSSLHQSLLLSPNWPLFQLPVPDPWIRSFREILVRQNGQNGSISWLHGMQWYAMYINVYILFMVSFVGSTLEYVHPWSIWEQLLPCFLALREGFP